MFYSAFGLLAVIIHLIVNYDVFHKRIGSTFPAVKQYRVFLLSVIIKDTGSKKPVRSISYGKKE